jgi:membrane protein
MSEGGKGLVERLRHYFRVTIWLGEPPPGLGGLAVRKLRIGAMILEGFARLGLFRMAAALAFVSLLAAAPLAVAVLSLLKGVGALQPAIDSLRGEGGFVGWIGAELAAFGAIEDTSGTGMAALGILALLVLFLMVMLERGFNLVWGVRRGRAMLRRIAVYWTLGTAGVLFAFISIASGLLLYSQPAGAEGPARVGLAGSPAALIGGPLLLAIFVFAASYLFVPNTHIRTGPALLGGIAGGACFEFFKHGGMILAVGASAMPPVAAAMGVTLALLGGLYFAWVSALAGGQLVFALQHVRTHRRELDLPTASVESKERVALRAVLVVCRAFLKGIEGPTLDELTSALRVPLRLTSQVVYQLIAMGILRELARTEKRGTGLVPARDPSQITVKGVIDAFRQYGSSAEGSAEDPSIVELEEVVQRARGRAEGALDRVSFRDLADQGKAPAARAGRVTQASREE